MMITRRIVVKTLVVAASALVLSGGMCGSNNPRDPHLHRDVCAHCRMSISDLKFAAQIIGPGNQIRFYDDLGCALWHRHREGDLQKGVLYVRHPQENRWVQATSLSYGKGFRTPMDFGFAPIVDQQTTERLSLEDVTKILIKQSATSEERP